MTESLHKVLSSIIVPQYDELVDVSVLPVGLVGDWFKIVYYFNPPLDKEIAIEIMQETVSLYKMVGHTSGDIIIDFKKIEKED